MKISRLNSLVYYVYFFINCGPLAYAVGSFKMAIVDLIEVKN